MARSQVEQEAGAARRGRSSLPAVLINILNPKLTIFFFAFLPQFVRADESSPLRACSS